MMARGEAMQRLREFLATWSPRRRLFATVVVLGVIFDQLSKFWAVGALTRAFDAGREGTAASFGAKLSRFLWDAHPARGRAVTVLEDFWHFRYAENPGAAWSFLASAPEWFRQPFFLLVSLVAMAFIVVYFRRTTDAQRLVRWGLSLVFAGAVGNFIDRARLGYVIDFIDWHWYDKATWPTFNVADSCITVGVAILVLDMLKNPKGAPASQPASSAVGK
jgi:signal peptidase II